MAGSVENKAYYDALSYYGVVSDEAEKNDKKSKDNSVSKKIEEMNSQIDDLKRMAANLKNNSDSAASIANNFNPTMEMSKIASASTSFQVRRYIQGVNMKIGILKKNPKYATLVKRFEKIIAKADEKIIKLQREERLEKKAKELERIKEHKAGRKVRDKKEVLKRGRMLQEADDVRNADVITYVDESATVSALVGDVSSMGGTVAVSAAEVCSVDVSV